LGQEVSAKNSKRKKISNRTKFFSVKPGVLFARAVIYLLNPFPGQ
jgi:hypothetical protein